MPNKRFDMTEKNIRIRVSNPANFEEGSFRLVPIDEEQGVFSVVGKTLSGGYDVLSYVFNLEKGWDLDKAKDWLTSYLSSQGNVTEAYAKHKRIIVASLDLCSKMPDLNSKKASVDRLKTEAKLNDKLYFFSEGVHAGSNLNGDYFFEEELNRSYKSAAGQLLDWEHDRSQIIGHTRDSELFTNEDNIITLGFNGIINRLSPYVQMFETEDQTRDEIMIERFYKGQLMVSMEAYFDEIKCTACEFRTRDILEFEHHKYTAHADANSVFRGLIGVDFVGFGMVKYPADPKAEVMSLRTSDEGMINDIIEASHVNRYGVYAYNVAVGNLIAKSEPTCGLDRLFSTSHQKNVKKIDEVVHNKPIKADKGNESDSIGLENNDDYDNDGGFSMSFKLKENTKNSKNLSEIFVVAQNVLKDYKGDKQLSEDEVKAFSSEVSEVVAEYIKNDFEIDGIYEITKADKADALTNLRNEKDTEIEGIKSQHDTVIAAKDAEIERLKGEITARENEINELKAAEATRETDALFETAFDELATAGLELTDGMKDIVKAMASARVNEENKIKDVLENVKSEFIALAKKKALIEGSDANGGGAVPGEKTKKSGLDAKLEELAEQYK